MFIDKWRFYAIVIRSQDSGGSLQIKMDGKLEKRKVGKMKKTKILALLLSLAMLVGLITACGTNDTPTDDGPGTNASSPPPSTPPSDDGKTEAPVQPAIPEVPTGARIADHIEIVKDNQGVAVINPNAIGAGGGMVWFTYIMILDTLVYRVDGGMEFAGRLATDWETDDWQTFIFHLRDDVYFHNGDHFTADDVVANIEYTWANPGGEATTVWGRVETARALDPYTVELVTYNVDVDLLFELASPPAGFMSPRAIRENPETGPWIGTGPWKISGFSTSNYVEFERNDDYWGEIPPTKTLALRFIPEPAARTMMLQNGECQFSFGISPEDIELFENDPNFTVYPSRTNFIFSVWFNMAHPVCSDYNFRMAVAHALDLDAITLVAADRSGDRVTDAATWGRNTQFRLDGLPNRERDLDLAREYLAKSPYKGEQIVITAAIADNIRAAEVVQQQLSEIGIDLFVNVTDLPGFTAYTQTGNSKLEMAFFLNAPMGYASSMRQFFYPGTARNGLEYNNPRVAELFDLALSEIDVSLRESYYHEIQQIMYDDPPQINVFWLVHGFIGSSKLGGFTITGESTHDFRNVFLLLDD